MSQEYRGMAVFKVQKGGKCGDNSHKYMLGYLDSNLKPLKMIGYETRNRLYLNLQFLYFALKEVLKELAKNLSGGS